MITITIRYMKIFGMIKTFFLLFRNKQMSTKEAKKEKNEEDEREKRRQKNEKCFKYAGDITFAWRSKDAIKAHELYMDWYNNHKPGCKTMTDKTCCTCKEWESIFFRRFCPTDYNLPPLSDYPDMHQIILSYIDGRNGCNGSRWSRISDDGTAIIQDRTSWTMLQKNYVL